MVAGLRRELVRIPTVSQDHLGKVTDVKILRESRLRRDPEDPDGQGFPLPLTGPDRSGAAGFRGLEDVAARCLVVLLGEGYVLAGG